MMIDSTIELPVAELKPQMLHCHVKGDDSVSIVDETRLYRRPLLNTGSLLWFVDGIHIQTWNHYGYDEMLEENADTLIRYICSGKKV